MDSIDQNTERAIRADPQNRSDLQQLANNYLCLRHYADAERVLDRAIALDPKDSAMLALRAATELDWHADTHPLRSTMEAIVAEDSREGQNVCRSGLDLRIVVRARFRWRASRPGCAAERWMSR